MKTGLINNSKLYNECIDCAERSERCHSTCKRYAVEVIMGIMLEAHQRVESDNREASYEVQSKRAARIARSSPSLKRSLQGSSYLKSR